jgi:hypothetical protein
VVGLEGQMMPKLRGIPCRPAVDHVIGLPCLAAGCSERWEFAGRQVDSRKGIGEGGQHQACISKELVEIRA